MRATKRRIAVLLAALLTVPTQPVWAVEPPQSVIESTMLQETTEEKVTETVTTSTSSDAFVDEEEAAYVDGELVDDVNKASSSNAETKKAEDEVIFNTGNCAYSVVSFEDFRDNEIGDAYFDSNGEYTINIPEENPFFPYEVQFTYEGETTEEWFMTPDDSVEIGGHKFNVSAYFDGTVVTQMSLEVAGDTVVAYPEKKEFTDGDGAMEMSMLPLEAKNIRVDMSEYAPIALSMVSIDSLFAGEREIEATDHIMWTYGWDDHYSIERQGAVVDLSYGTSSGTSTEWEMIVGDDDQLASSNVRYHVRITHENTSNWISPVVYKLDDSGNKNELNVLDYDYSDYYSYNYNVEERTARYMEIWLSSLDALSQDTISIGLSVDQDVFFRYPTLKVFEGEHTTAEEAEGSTEITDQILDTSVGYSMLVSDDKWVTFVAYNSDGQAVGCLPFYMNIYRRTMSSRVSGSLSVKKDDYFNRVTYSYTSKTPSDEDCRYEVHSLYAGYPADGQYYARLTYYDQNEYGESVNAKVTAAYVGQYASIKEAEEAGAANVKNALFGSGTDSGYLADYSQGVYFTTFVGEDGAEGQQRFCTNIQAIEGTTPLSSNVSAYFYGLRDENKQYVSCKAVGSNVDSYAEYNYLTILADPDTDLTKLAPTFSIDDKIRLYAEGSSTPEISGESFHDFSDGPVQYTASAEDGINSKNYWLQVVKATEAEGWLYINSLADEDAKTKVENGVTYSTREVMLDGYHDYYHDIFIANMGKEKLNTLSVDVSSDQVELDEYWTLKGKYDLEGALDEFGNYNGEPQNAAKIRLKAKKGAEAGSDITGTLTIKSGDLALVVLTLTGTVGDPTITTKDIPKAVKYVPYGTMIQNSNKYSSNKVSYSLRKGSLPNGMELKANGELYGVPTETGTFAFTVRLTNSKSGLPSSERTFTLEVIENTDANVDAATDQGYDLTQRIQNVTLTSAGDQLMVSQGVLDEFIDLYLDGVKLQKSIDYDAESGSTRITIRSQTLKSSNTVGTHTLGMEFRTKDTNTLKRAAQNYTVTRNGSSSGSGSSSGGSSSGGSSSSGSSGSSTSTTNSSSNMTRDSKKGYMNSQSGIITGEGTGYSHWTQDENGWKLIYADGTTAAGSMVEQADKTTVEHFQWEKVNALWYAFGADGYIKTGWIYDVQSGQWYFMSPENGMKTGWHTEPQDGCVYYLEPSNGQIVTGWRQIDGKWYYFNDELAAPTWIFDEETGKWQYNVKSKTKPFGARLSNGKTPDGYTVGEDGALIQ